MVNLSRHEGVAPMVTVRFMVRQAHHEAISPAFMVSLSNHEGSARGVALELHGSTGSP
jgi:hypothetical protein